MSGGANSAARLRAGIVGAFRLAWTASPRGIVGTTMLALFSGGGPPLVVWLSKRLVDSAVNLSGTGRATAQLWIIVGALGLCSAATRTISLLQSHQQRLFAERVELDATERFLAKAAAVDLGFYDDPAWHDRARRAEEGLNHRPFGLVFAVTGLAGTAVTLVGMFGILLSLDPSLVALAVVSVLPLLIGQRRVNRRIYQLHLATTADQRELHYLQEVIAGAHLAKELRAYGLERHFQERRHNLARAVYARKARLFGRAGRVALLSGLVSGVALTAGFALVAARATQGRLTAGDLTALIAAVAAVTAQASLLASSLALVDEHSRFLSDYFDFLGVEPRVRAPDRPVPLPACLDAGIVLDDVTFGYPRGSRPAVSGLSLRVAPGEMVAIVGDNGAGKSTVVKLLLRFYDPTEGAIRLGGVDLRTAEPEAIRARIGVLFQDFAAYELSVRENVALGRIDLDLTDERVREALEAARATPFLDGLPHGLDSKVGRLFEGGHDLSGGEWQRLALARLLYRDADVWILDEPTASLDAEAEAAVFSELRRRLGKRMGIVISHRFSTVRIADRILVMAAGRVIEEGRHEELMALGGRYAALFDLQAVGYR